MKFRKLIKNNLGIAGQIITSDEFEVSPNESEKKQIKNAIKLGIIKELEPKKDINKEKKK